MVAGCFSMLSLAPHVVRFAGFSLDTRTGELSQNGQRQLLLPEQMFLVLATLTRQPGDLVTREELASMLWGNDVNVDFDGGINAVIRRLRDVLGDSAIAPRFIETLPRRGYRFIARVEPATLPSIEPAVAPAATSTVAPDRSRTWLIVLAGAVVLTVGVASWRRMPQGRVAELTRLTSTSGLNTDPTLSPDGAFAAYASDRAGKGSLDIWVQPVAGGDPIQLTDSPDDEAEPAFSPDGAKVVFANRFSERNVTGVYVIDALGGDARLIDQAQSARNPRFSPAVTPSSTGLDSRQASWPEASQARSERSSSYRSTEIQGTRSRRSWLPHDIRSGHPTDSTSSSSEKVTRANKRWIGTSRAVMEPRP